MLPPLQRILFLIFAAVTGSFGVWGFVRLYRRIAAGRPDSDARTNNFPARLWYALITTLTQRRTFRKRPWVSFFHSFIFYGFSFYLLVNLLDAIDGFVPLSFRSLGLAGQLYILFADVLSALVLVGVVALVLRRFALPSRRDFTFNPRTLLHKDVKQNYISLDSIIVSSFILFHVGSRAVGAGATLAAEGPDRFAPFATLLSHLFTAQNALAWRIFGYWGALGSVLAFLAYFPYSKHIHIFMASAKYTVARDVNSGVLPAMQLDMEAEEPKLGAGKLEDLAWPRLLDAYACIQCNRCQDVCPATATGKSLSPSALEINKRMELNDLAKHQPSFETGAPSPHPLLSFALSPEAAWACTTCGACMQVCPVQDEPMLDIIDVRREQVMMAGEFPPQLQTAFRGMERAQNPWGVNHAKRMDWAEGLSVKTTDENPDAEVLYWVGCAASYDPQSQKTARSMVELLNHAGVNFAVLGKKECCTGDSARRAGNEYLYRQLADQNVTTLNALNPKKIVASCPHCMNAIGKEYKQIGGDYEVVHHSEFLDSLVAEGKLTPEPVSGAIAFHDPCYLGRHNGVYDAPRNVLKVLSNTLAELPRSRENSFCCGAGGAQFWKEEEPGSERISDNRYREAQQTLPDSGDRVLAVGCPFCKSMLESTPGKGADSIPVKDIAELLLEGIHRRNGSAAAAVLDAPPSVVLAAEAEPVTLSAGVEVNQPDPALAKAATKPLDTAEPGANVQRRKWAPKAAPQAVSNAAAETSPAPLPAVEPVSDSPAIHAVPEPESGPAEALAVPAVTIQPEVKRKAWTPKKAAEPARQASAPTPPVSAGPSPTAVPDLTAAAPLSTASLPTASEYPATAPPAETKRKTWAPKRSVAPEAGTAEPALPPHPVAAANPEGARKLWKPKASVAKPTPGAQDGTESEAPDGSKPAE